MSEQGQAGLYIQMIKFVCSRSKEYHAGKSGENGVNVLAQSQ
jgi:hypothetical protein